MVVIVFLPLASTKLVANISNCPLEPHLETIIHVNKEGKFLVDVDGTIIFITPRNSGVPHIPNRTTE